LAVEKRNEKKRFSDRIIGGNEYPLLMGFKEKISRKFPGGSTLSSENIFLSICQQT
jgi:hypothetical protein